MISLQLPLAEILFLCCLMKEQALSHTGVLDFRPHVLFNEASLAQLLNTFSGLFLDAALEWTLSTIQ